MLGAIKRVISGDDMRPDQSIQQDSCSPHDNRATATNDSAMTPNSQTMDMPHPALVENDMDIDMSEFRAASNFETPRSSLSDMSQADEIMQEVAFEPMDRSDADQQAMAYMRGNLVHVRGNFSRTDSRASSDDGSVKGTGSQNSSRDWGWFEDVHASENALTPPSQLKRKDGSAVAGSTSKSRDNKNMLPRGGLLLVPASSITMEECLMPISHPHPQNLENEAAAMAVTAPTYVLEESLSNQKLWKYTAGNRPPQPIEERAFFERMWAQNFVRSQVEYRMPVEVLTAVTPISLSPFADGNFDTVPGNELSNYSVSDESTPGNAAEAALLSRLNDPHTDYDPELLTRTVKGDGGDLTVSTKGDNVFGTTVSKSFARPSDRGGPIMGVDTINISVASYRVVESNKHGKYAQFLVIYREGSIRDTIGVWKRYSDFQELSKKVTQVHEGCAAVIANMSPLAMTEEPDVEHLPNAITSWRLLKKRQRWYRCLDAGYLSLKVFLLERFLHDILFESSNPKLLRDFVGDQAQASP